MTTFDLKEVLNFAANLNSRLTKCDNGEGMECSNHDAMLRQYASICCEFHEGVREWGRSVFSGLVKFDPHVDSVWHKECEQLFSRAEALLAYSDGARKPCYALDGEESLRSALLGLHRLLTPWVSPCLAVGPSARNDLGLDTQAGEKALRQVASLPPLDAEWKPSDVRQQRQLSMLLNRRSG